MSAIYLKYKPEILRKYGLAINIQLETKAKLFTEKEIECCPPERDAVGMADRTIRRILNRSVILQVADRPVWSILHPAVRLDVADCPVAAVLDGSVGLDMGHGLVARVLHRLGTDGSTDGKEGDKDEE